MRFCLRAGAGYLAYIGVSSDDQSQFIEVTVGVVVPLILVFVAEAWSFLQKRFMTRFAELSYLSNPAKTSIEEVKVKASESMTFRTSI